MSTPSGRIVRRSRGERRLSYAFKLLAVIVLSAIVLSGILDFMARVRSVTIVLIGAVFFTYAIYPAVRRLNARLPLVWSIALVYLGIAILAAFGFAVVVPALAADTQSLIKAMPSIVHNAQVFFSDLNNPIFRHLPPQVRDYLASLPLQVDTLTERYAGQAAQRTLSFLLSAVAVIATVVVIPVIAVYVMIDLPWLLDGVFGAIPPKARPKVQAMLSDVDKVLGGFIRGQFLVGATIGAAITVVLLVMHVRYAVLIGVMAGLFDIIPYVGAVVAFIPATLLAFFNDGWQHAAIIAVSFVLIFQLEGHVIAPRIVSDSVGLSPLMVIVAILIGGELGGIGGMFLSVPIAALLRVLLVHVVPHYGVDRLAAAPAPSPENSAESAARRARPASKARA